MGGYLGKRGSVLERSHIQNVEPLPLVMTLLCLQV
jgi:hypothetical protein